MVIYGTVGEDWTALAEDDFAFGMVTAIGSRFYLRYPQILPSIKDLVRIIIMGIDKSVTADELTNSN